MPLPPSGEVRVHVLDLTRAPARVGELLPSSDLRRAEQQGPRWANARAGLRAILGDYLGADPAAIKIRDEDKPRLDPPSPLRFNLSHSHDVAAIAIATEREVGIDVERIEEDRDVARLAKRMFLNAEQAAVHEAEDPIAAYHQHWVAKEAFTKATGKGLASMRSFEISLDGPAGPRLVHIANDQREANRWSLSLLEDLPPGYVGALASEVK